MAKNLNKRRIVWDDEVEELDLGDGDVVVLKARMSVEDEVAIDQASMQAQQTEAGLQLNMDPALYSQALLHVMIKEWRGPSFVDRAGNPLECTVANINRLDRDTANAVRKRIDEVNSKRDDGEKKDSTESSSSPSTTETSSPAS